MPRIDPLQLLKCLSVLLNAHGGIKSKDEVNRLANLMSKFSKKLVSKCIYIQILKTTKTDILGMFMGAGGWSLSHSWLVDAVDAKNWPLIQELLELLLMCPVDVARLKSNTCPMLIKGLCKKSTSESVKLLATKLVEQWLKILKGDVTVEVKCPSKVGDIKPAIDSTADVPKECGVEKDVISVGSCDIVDESTKVEVQVTHSVEVVKDVVESKNEEGGMSEESGEDAQTWDAPIGQLPVFKITFRDGKRVLAKVHSGKTCRKSNVDGVVEPVDKSSIKSSVDTVLETDSIKPELVSTQESETLSTTTVRTDETQISKGNSVLDVKLNQNVKSKTKTEKSDAIPVDSVKLMKDAQKKSRESEVSSKSLDKKLKSSDSSKDKVKELSKDKDKLRDKSKDNNDRVKDKVKDKKSIVDRSAQAEKDKATLAKLIPPTISKLGKIPKKSDKKIEDTFKSSEIKKSANDGKKSPDTKKTPIESKKNSISIEVRKSSDSSRPKTVKTFNSKFRSTGLEEEVKPPPSRSSVKKSSSQDKKPLKLPTLKRTSPLRESVHPEKKPKISPTELSLEDSKKNEKAGGIKLIPPRPKPILQESDMFMDALNASTKKEPRKRKRRASSSKDGQEAKKEINGKDEESKDTTPPSSPTVTDSKLPLVVKPTLKFYQDTLETESEKEVGKSNNESEMETEQEPQEVQENDDKEPRSTTPIPEDGSDNSSDTKEEKGKSKTSDQEETTRDPDVSRMTKDVTLEVSGKFPKGVLIYHKLKKGPKKTVRWKTEKDLEMIRYFELDETERANVTKTFTDMSQMERSNEREAFLHARKLPQDDTMEEKTVWQPLIPIDVITNLGEAGQKSRERQIQFAREKVVLQALYFSRDMVPDTAAEPDLENHATTDPVTIPLDDVTGNSDSVLSYQGTPWPESKPILIPQSPPPQFLAPQPPPFPTFPMQQFPGQPVMANNIMPPNGKIIPGGDWRTGDGKVVALNDMQMTMDIYNQPNMNMGMGMGMSMPMPGMNYTPMMGGEEMAPFPPQGYPMGAPPGVYPVFRGSRAPMGGRGVNGQMGPRGPGGLGGPGGPGGPWFRPNGPPMGNNWQNNRGGRGNWGGPNRSICKHFRSGYCRQEQNCPYLHPGVNGPQF